MIRGIVITLCLCLVAGALLWDFSRTHSELDAAKRELAVLSERMDAADRVLRSLGELRNEIEIARRENVDKLAQSFDVTGDERYDYLDRLLTEDADRRKNRGGAASGGAPDAMR